MCGHSNAEDAQGRKLLPEKETGRAMPLKGWNRGTYITPEIDHRMIRNYLSGTAGDKINTLLAATAYNMRKWMRLKRQEILNLIFRWIYQALILR